MLAMISAAKRTLRVRFAALMKIVQNPDLNEHEFKQQRLSAN